MGGLLDCPGRVGQRLLPATKKARGKPHHVAVRALAFKWMRILYRCWKDRQPYREEIYLASLAKRRTAMVAALAKAKGVQMS